MYGFGLEFLLVFYTLILKTFSQSLSLYSHLFLDLADLLEFGHSVFDSHWWW